MLSEVFKRNFIVLKQRKNWSSCPLSNLITEIIGGDWGKELPSGKHTEEVYCIRGTDIPLIEQGNKGKMPVRYIQPRNYNSKKLFDGDIVIEVSGGSPTQSTGRATIIKKTLLDRFNQKIVCTNFCRALKPRDGYSSLLYFYWLFLYEKGVFFSYENGTTGIKNLDLDGVINNEIIHIPPFEQVEEFEQLCCKTFAQIHANGEENEKLALLRDTLLPQLMSGELEVSLIDF